MFHDINLEILYVYVFLKYSLFMAKSAQYQR